MFTGIIKGIGLIEEVERKPGLQRFKIKLPDGFDGGLELGASVAVDGVCLTVAQHQGMLVTFDIMQETLNRTSLGGFSKGDTVNLERAAKDGAEVGGHPISGHIDCTAKIAKIEKPENNFVITFEVPPAWMKYIFEKGYVALNGASLTITGVNKQNRTFQVWLIPETLRLTTFAQKNEGNLVNLEVERGTLVTVDTIRDFLEERLATLLPSITESLSHSLQNQAALDITTEVQKLKPK